MLNWQMALDQSLGGVIANAILAAMMGLQQQLSILDGLWQALVQCQLPGAFSHSTFHHADCYRDHSCSHPV